MAAFHTPPMPTAPPAAQAALSAVTSAPQALRVTRQRTWPAVLTLFFLAPAVAEMLSGSTPPLMFVNPFSLLLETGLYGSGALLVRELVRRRGLGWASVLLLGAAYGVLEEGLTITSWFNPYWPDLQGLSSYGRLLDTNWVWALGLTIYHAVVSITIPILLAETLFPRSADLPWLGRRGFRFFVAWLTLISIFTLLVFGLLAFSKTFCTTDARLTVCHAGYALPPLMWCWALGLAVALVLLGLSLHPPAAAHFPQTRPAPRLWRLRLTGLSGTIAFFFLLWAGPSIVPLALALMLLIAGLIVLAVWRVRRWAARPGWGMEHRLALAMGALSFFLLLAPLLEFGGAHPGKIMTGMTLVAVLWLTFFIALARRAGRAAPAQTTTA
jgi:hypothetical protein